MHNDDKTVDNAVERPYTLRALNDEDLYPILDIIAMVCPENLQPIFQRVLEKADSLGSMDGDDAAEIAGKITEEIGVDIMMQLALAILRSMKTVKDDVYALLSDVSGIPAEDIRRMPFGTTPMMILDIVRDKRNRHFFGASSKSP